MTAERARRDASVIQMPGGRVAPLAAIGRRLGLALALLVFMGLVVLIERDGYTDVADGHVSVLDAFYFAAVSATTTGFGDIAPISDTARFFDLVLVTPARVLFLVVLVGTTLEALTEQSRRAFAARRWRKRVRDHHVICGYGSTGRSAIRALRAQGVPPDEIVVIERAPTEAERARRDGYVTVQGDMTQQTVLTQGNVAEAVAIVVTPGRDDTAVLATLTAREMNPTGTIAAAVREAENRHLLDQSGADSVIHSADAAGRLLGMATHSASAAKVLDDLMLPGSGLDVAECAPVETADGGWGAPPGSSLLAVVRDMDGTDGSDGSGKIELPVGTTIRSDDRLVVLRLTGSEP